jgi:hypothetical protein
VKSKHLGWVIVLILITVQVPILSAISTSEDVLAPDPEFDPSLGLDVPTYRVGDYWNYTTSFTVDVLGFPVPFSGWMNFSVNFVTLDFTYSDSPVYITNLTGNVSGFLKIDLLGIDERIYLDLSGYIWERIQDLSMYRMVLNATVSGTQSSINGHYPFGYEYSPALEQYDFPLIPDEEWRTNVSATLPFGSSGEILNVQQNLSCGSLIQKTVPAGTFNTYPVSIDGTPSLYYNETVGTSVERVFDLEVSGLAQTVVFELDEYYRQQEESRIKIWIDSEEPVWAGGTFDVSGELSSGDTVVTLLFPGSTIAATIPLIGQATTFTRTLTAPWEMDDTPTIFDHGSFGIFAIVGSLVEYDVCTVTTKALDVMVNSSSLKVTATGNWTEFDVFTANITIFNPLNYGVDDVLFNLSFKDGDVILEQTITRIDARTSFSMDIELPKMDPGNKTLLLVIDPLDQIEEFNETNNRIEYNFTVNERPPLTYEASIMPGDLHAYEGDWVNITAVFFRGGAPIPPGWWTIDGVKYVVGEHFNHSIPHIGNFSHRDDPYIIEYHGNWSYFYEDENSTLRWDLHTENVNLGPQFVSFYPENDTLIINETEWIIFGARIKDPEGGVPYFYWIIDGIRTRDNTTEWVFTTGYLNNSSHGSPYTISVVAFDPIDPALNITRTWTVIVLDVDRPVEVEVTPEPGDLELDHDEWISFEIAINDPDMDPVNITWFVEKYPIWHELTFNYSFEEMDLEHDIYVDLEVNLSVGELWFYYNWTILVKVPPEPEEQEPVPPVGIVITSPDQDEEFTTEETILFRVTDEDERDLTFRWLINGSFHEGSEVSISGLTPGTYTVILNVSTEGPPPGWAEISVAFRVVLPGEEVVGEKEEDDDFPWWIVILVLLVSAAAIAAFTIIALRNRDVWEEE